MNTRELAAEYRLAHWAQVMRERRDSGMSIKAFCNTKGIHANVYYYWQRKLRDAACEQLTESGQLQQTSLAKPSFTEVKLIESDPPTLTGELTSHICVEVGGVRITADGAYPPEKLAVLLRELSR